MAIELIRLSKGIHLPTKLANSINASPTLRGSALYRDVNGIYKLRAYRDLPPERTYQARLIKAFLVRSTRRSPL